VPAPAILGRYRECRASKGPMNSTFQQLVDATSERIDLSEGLEYFVRGPGKSHGIKACSRAVRHPLKMQLSKRVNTTSSTERREAIYTSVRKNSRIGFSRNDLLEASSSAK
jgi:hypothetical protein